MIYVEKGAGYKMKILNKKPSRDSLAVGLLIMIGTIVRGYAAVCFQYSTNPDIGINALMTRHIALGKQFPFFFYGQSYMGTLEAWIAAPFYIAMGHGMLPVLLGSAVVAAASQWFLYRWVRNMAGNRAAFFATALYVFGSPSLFYYNIFLGYPALLLFGLICCWLAPIIVSASKAPASRWATELWTFTLGLAAGVGWWCNNMIVVFFPACILVILAGIKLKKLPFVGIAGLLGFVIGGSLWVLKALTDPNALFFLRQSGDVNLPHALPVVIHYISVALGFARISLWRLIPTLVGTVCVLVVYAIMCISCKTWKQRAHYFMPLMIIVTTAAICVSGSK